MAVTPPGWTPHSAYPEMGNTEGPLWVFSAVLYGMLGFLSWVTGGIDPGICCFGVIGAPLVYLALKDGQRRRRYGDARMDVTAPTELGGMLEGVVHVSHELAADGRVRATLVCRRDQGASHPDAVICRSVGFSAPHPTEEPGQGRIPVRVDVPASGLPSGLNRIYWTVQIENESGCPGLDIQFRILVDGKAPGDA